MDDGISQKKQTAVSGDGGLFFNPGGKRRRRRKRPILTSSVSCVSRLFQHALQESCSGAVEKFLTLAKAGVSALSTCREGQFFDEIHRVL
jgi:hypothetical protein